MKLTEKDKQEINALKAYKKVFIEEQKITANMTNEEKIKRYLFQWRNEPCTIDVKI